MNCAAGLAISLPLKEGLLMKYRPAICPFHALLEYVRSGDSILDIGCGSGLWLHLTNRLARSGSSLGLDIYRDKIEIAESIEHDPFALSFRCVAAADNWPVERQYDILSMIDVLHHVPAEAQESFVRRIAAVSPRRVIFKDIDPASRCKAAMNTLHDLVLSQQKPVYCRRADIVSWLENLGYNVIVNQRVDMLWYSHYLIVADMK